MGTMMALRAHQRGGPEQLVYSELTALAEMTEAGKLRPVISQTFPLADGRQAFASGRQHRPPGKTVLLVGA